MIPADVASRLRLITSDQPEPPQAVPSSRQLTDVLSDLVPGQRILAEIQALLPNGTYRAIVAQRDVTLALPFSAKPGDTLELEVAESDGQLTLAFVANRNAGQQAKGTGESVATTLSQAGKLIGNLLAGVDDQGRKAAPVPLNGNQPLVEAMPADAADLVPVLKESLMRSGMFYEAHQARWVEGKLPMGALLQEPQGKFSPAPMVPATVSAPDAQAASSPATSAAIKAEIIAAPGQSLPAAQGKEGPAAADQTPTGPDKILPGHASTTENRAETQAKSPIALPDLPAPDKGANPVQPDLAPLVRQQLDALASQNYVWQGQIWPGQNMHWEIEADREGRHSATGEDGRQQWQTRLKLTLPGLGAIDAVMRLHAGGALDLSLATDSNTARQALTAAGEGLRRRLEDAGLNLTAFTVHHDENIG